MTEQYKNLGRVAEGLRYLSSGFHAIPPKDDGTINSLPARHRLYNAYGMVIGFSAMKYVSDVMYGYSLNGSQYKVIEKEKVPAPFRFLHGIIKSNPFSDEPRDRWLTVLHKAIPAAGGAIGAVAGSQLFFNPREKGTEPGKLGVIDSIKHKIKIGETPSPLESDTLASWEQGKKWRTAAGASAWLASSSGLTGLLYGTALNSAFMLCNGGKAPAGAAEFFRLPFLRKFTNAPSKSFLGPQGSLDGMIKRAGNALKRAKDGNTEDLGEFYEDMAMSVFAPLFRKFTPKDRDQIIERVQGLYHLAEEQVKDGKAIDKAQEELKAKILELIEDKDLQKLGDGMFAGNNGWLGAIAQKLDFKGNISKIRKFAEVPDPTSKAKTVSTLRDRAKGHYKGLALAGAGAAAVGVLGLESSVNAATPANSNLKHMGAEEYMESVERSREHKKGRGFLNGRVLDFFEWLSNEALHVIPVHRFWTATGLTAGGGLGLYVAKILRGKSLSSGGKPFTISAASPLKKVLENGKFPIAGILKDKDIKQELITLAKKTVGDGNNLSDEVKANAIKKLELENKFRALGGLFAFMAFCAAGVGLGSKHAYKSTYKKNENPKSLEDYLARVRQHHGDKMIPFISWSSVFGSSAGTFLVPVVPGINYGASLAYRVVSMQDRNITTPGLRWITGNKTLSYFALREGLDFTFKYLAHNPDQQPEQLEKLAYVVLEPLARDAGGKLNGEQVKQFTDKLMAIRAKYWQQGGIPEAKQEEFTKELQSQFTGKGLDKTLYECGIDTLKINFFQVGGMLGKFSTLFGSTKRKVGEEQRNYRNMVEGWRREWKEEGAKKEAHAEEPAKEAAPHTEVAEEQTPAKIKELASKKPPVPFADVVAASAESPTLTGAHR